VTCMKTTLGAWCDENGEALFDDVAIVDWNEGQAKVLTAVDRQLAAYGLEILFYEDESTCNVWRIVPRSNK